MQLLSANLLSIITLLPAAAALLLLCIPEDARGRAWFRQGALAASLLTFVVSLLLLPGWTSVDGFRFLIDLPWISTIGARYTMGVDGISLWLVLLNTLLFPLAIISGYGVVKEREKLYYVLLLILESAITGVFLAQDLLLFFFFWEAVLIPMYFIIGLWGGRKRVYAATKFVIYTMVGSLLMLAAIIAVYQASGLHTFALDQLTARPMGAQLQLWCFLAFFLAFAIKVPLFPFHTWLPDAHTEAPTAGSIILAGVLLKMGTYGFIRLAIPLFPDAAVMPLGPLELTLQQIIMALSVVGIIYGALVAAVQTDVKRLVAYSSIAHLGFVMLGVFSLQQQAVDGAVWQMVAHGISTGALFMLVGFIYERRHTRAIADFGGLAAVMPVYFNIFLVIMLSSVGLPILNGFVGEFLVLIGSFQVNWLLTLIATSGVILAAVYLLFMFRRVFFGELTHEENRSLLDLDRRELAAILPLAALAILMGIFPTPFLSRISPDTERLLAQVQSTRTLSQEPEVEAGMPAALELASGGEH